MIKYGGKWGRLWSSFIIIVKSFSFPPKSILNIPLSLSLSLTTFWVIWTIYITICLQNSWPVFTFQHLFIGLEIELILSFQICGLLLGHWNVQTIQSYKYGLVVWGFSVSCCPCVCNNLYLSQSYSDHSPSRPIGWEFCLGDVCVGGGGQFCWLYTKFSFPRNFKKILKILALAWSNCLDHWAFCKEILFISLIIYCL